ncbi:hypothetical protein SCA03_26770 [Streptomyces cacaoi]|uniref:Uncharacterized protein n=1 Tax=Streptomyces cacaoi TaxID=1898 RepID=A0A4Y3QXH3_STRCI|nr:hypothetical protein SCA03_26770 [Streptomyces cacaoi]
MGHFSPRSLARARSRTVTRRLRAPPYSVAPDEDGEDGEGEEGEEGDGCADGVEGEAGGACVWACGVDCGMAELLCGRLEAP